MVAVPYVFAPNTTIVSAQVNANFAALVAFGNTLGTMSLQDANTVAITGGTITGLPTPSVSSDAATKGYVDSAVTALHGATGFFRGNGLLSQGSSGVTSAGIGASFRVTPLSTGRLLINVGGTYINVAQISQIGAYIGSGVAPTQGNAVGGTLVTNSASFTPNTTNVGGFALPALTGVISGLSVGTSYWIDVGAVTSIYASSTSFVISVGISVVET